jgi:hypothetical protein
MSHATARPGEFGILDRIIRPGRSDLSAEAARAFLEMTFDQQDRERMLDLLAKCKDGRLTPDEARALDEYRRLGRFLDMLHSKARLALRRLGQDVE